MVAAVGQELALQLYPTDGVELRDSGQLSMANAILATLHPTWSARLESPIGAGDRRAADILLTRHDEKVEIEIERSLVDLQAQLRAGQLKRNALAERSDVPVRLVIAVPDGARIRARLAPFEELLAQALPIRSREVMAALRMGQPIGGDALLFVRAGRLTAASSTR
jgi:hypothetical protein